jgi:hypothetical protein
VSHQDLADAVREVLIAARGWREARKGALSRLRDAVDALDAALANAGPVVLPDTPWREVLAGDEVYAPKTDRWYEVLGVDSLTRFAQLKTEVVLDIDGTARTYTRDSEGTVTVRRPASPESDAVAVLTAAGFDLTTLASGCRCVGPDHRNGCPEWVLPV